MTELGHLAAAATALDELLRHGGLTDPERHAAIGSAMVELRVRIEVVSEWARRLADEIARAVAAAERKPQEN